MEIRPEKSLILAIVYLALFVFGIAYNQLIAWMEKKKYLEGYTAFAVAGGVTITLGAVAFIDWEAALLVLGAFCCSGAWMVIGSWWRHVQARKDEQSEIRGEK